MTTFSRAATQMGVPPWPKNDALARRWPNGDGGRCGCTLPNSPRRRSPTSSACTPPPFAATSSGSAIQSAPGNPPDVQEAYFIRIQKNDVQPGTVAVRPETPASGKINEPRGGGRILERKEDLRPTGRRIRPPTEVVISICKTTQNNAVLRKRPQFHEDSRKHLQIPASYSRTEELPSPTRKPFCELDLHRRIHSFPLFGSNVRPAWASIAKGLKSN